MSDEYKILNMADMLVDSKGNEVTVSQRLEDIKERYGEYSDEYLTACDICYDIGLTAINFLVVENVIRGSEKIGLGFF